MACHQLMVTGFAITAAGNARHIPTTTLTINRFNFIVFPPELEILKQRFFAKKAAINYNTSQRRYSVQCPLRDISTFTESF
jgi:hypothetical protein